jgi:hypothetical protein
MSNWEKQVNAFKLTDQDKRMLQILYNYVEQNPETYNGEAIKSFVQTAEAAKRDWMTDAAFIIALQQFQPPNLAKIQEKCTDEMKTKVQEVFDCYKLVDRAYDDKTVLSMQQIRVCLKQYLLFILYLFYLGDVSAIILHHCT